MTEENCLDRPFHQLMQAKGIPNFKALAQISGVSEKAIRRLRRGAIATARIETLTKLGQVFDLSAEALLTTLQGASSERPPVTGSSLQAEYDRLQAHLAEQRETLWQEFQQQTLQTLESLILQLPTAAYAAQNNPQAPAVKLLPLLRPIDQLLTEWNIQAIAPVGAEVEFDPQWHQGMEGAIAPGEPVRIRYTGYRQGDRLLYRAKVSRV